MWEKIDYKGFEIWVLPILAYGPPAPNTPYHYNGYVCRPGADLRAEGNVQFNAFDEEREVKLVVRRAIPQPRIMVLHQREL